MKQINILHIEDEELDAQIIKTALNENSILAVSYNITHVMSMKEAIHKIDKYEYHVVLLDLHLPDVRGVDNVRCLYRGNDSVPIIVLTGLDSESCVNEVLKAGAQECIAKGNCNGEILQRIIKATIQRQASFKAETDLNSLIECA